jgi:cell division protein FtsN
MKPINFLLLASVVALGFSCKTSEKTTFVPGAYRSAEAAAEKNVEATVETTAASTAAASRNESTIIEFPKEEPKEEPKETPKEEEITRPEVFTFSEGDESAMDKKFHVVVGSFRNQSNAKGLQSTLKAEGHNAIIVVNDLGMFRVLLASHNEYASARSEINKIKNRFPDAWVLVQKK